MSDSKHDSNEEFEAPVSLHCVVLEDGVNVEEHIVGVFDVNGLIMIRSLDRKLLRGKKVALTRSRLFRALALERWAEENQCVFEDGQVSRESAEPKSET